MCENHCSKEARVLISMLCFCCKTALSTEASIEAPVTCFPGVLPKTKIPTVCSKGADSLRSVPQGDLSLRFHVLLGFIFQEGTVFVLGGLPEGERMKSEGPAVWKASPEQTNHAQASLRKKDNPAPEISPRPASISRCPARPPLHLSYLCSAFP